MTRFEAWTAAALFVIATCTLTALAVHQDTRRIEAKADMALWRVDALTPQVDYIAGRVESLHGIGITIVVKNGEAVYVLEQGE